MAYSNRDADKLYSLLPTYIRERDVESGEPLRGLLRIIEERADDIEGDIQQLYENAFIETSEPWVVPYIGDLVATTPLFDESRVRDGNTAGELFRDLTGPSLKPNIALRSRADVAKTIYYRRRKGTLPMLEELARDVTGWASHTVEFFELLIWNQWVRNHLRMHAPGTPDIRSVERMGRVARSSSPWIPAIDDQPGCKPVARFNGAFDEVSHTVDVRKTSRNEGWHNIRNIGFFLWRLSDYKMERVHARRLGGAGDFRYHFSPLGNCAPLFSKTRREGDESGLATELHVPQSIRPARFFEDLREYGELPLEQQFGYSEFYGLFNAFGGFNIAPDPSLMVFVTQAGVREHISVERVLCRNLSVWSPPGPDQIAVDVERGRLTLGANLVPADLVEVYYHYGFPANMGGGPYRRRAWLTDPQFAENILPVNDSGDPGTFQTISAALTHWNNNTTGDTIIRIGDNRTYNEAITINPHATSGGFISIEAEDGFRPHIQVEGAIELTGDRPDFTATFGGLLIEGNIEITGSHRRLRLLHSTVVPGRSIAETDPEADEPPPAPAIGPSISAVDTLPGGAPANTELSVELAFSITGPIRLPDHAEKLYALDSIIDGVQQNAIAGSTGEDSSGPPVHLERVTVRGDSFVRQIDFATEVIFDGLIIAERIQTGCVRFCYVRPESRTPQRYRCQPDLAEKLAIDREEAESGTLTPPEIIRIREIVQRRVKPEFTAEDYGLPAYIQLSLNGPVEIATGAEDGSEMGAYCHLKQPQREANLRLRLEEYLPFGLEYGIIYVT